MKIFSIKRVALILALALVLQGCTQTLDTVSVQQSTEPPETAASSPPQLIEEDSVDEEREDITEPVEATEMEVSQWKSGMPVPNGYTLFEGQLIDEKAFIPNPDGTLSWNPSFPPPKGFVLVDGLLMRESASAEETMPEAGTSNQASSNVSGEQSGAADSPIASEPPVNSDPEPIEEPAKPKPTPEPIEESNPLPNPGDYCPGYREENPSLYDSCHAGFVAPTLEWAGYHSCRKNPDGNVQIFGKVKLVGGNYNKNDYGWDTHAIDGLGIVNSINLSSPYFVSWYAGAWFGSMDGYNKGIIARTYNSGMEKIDESLLDPSCRF